MEGLLFREVRLWPSSSDAICSKAPPPAPIKHNKLKINGNDDLSADDLILNWLRSTVVWALLGVSVMLSCGIIE